MLLVAGTGMILTGMQTHWQTAWAVTGIGGASVTSAYGLYMVNSALRTLWDHEQSVSPNA